MSSSSLLCNLLLFTLVTLAFFFCFRIVHNRKQRKKFVLLTGPSNQFGHWMLHKQRKSCSITQHIDILFSWYCCLKTATMCTTKTHPNRCEQRVSYFFLSLLTFPSLIKVVSFVWILLLSVLFCAANSLSFFFVCIPVRRSPSK